MRGIYLAGSEARSGKSAVAVGLAHHLARRHGRVGVFRPIVRVDARNTPAKGEDLYVVPKAGETHVFSTASGERISA